MIAPLTQFRTMLFFVWWFACLSLDQVVSCSSQSKKCSTRKTCCSYGLETVQRGLDKAFGGQLFGILGRCILLSKCVGSRNNKLDGGDDLSCMLSHGVSILPRCRCIMERLACKEAIIISAAGRSFLRPREDFRRVREWFSGVWHQ